MSTVASQSEPSQRSSTATRIFWRSLQSAKRISLALLILYALLSLVAGIILAERSLHLRRNTNFHRAFIAGRFHDRFQADLQDVAIKAKDGAVLKGWYAAPANANGSAVILLHGIGDNRAGMAGYAALMLQHGYSVLLPDARDHGESGGDIATYGLLERDDIHRWVSWLEGKDHPACVYGIGESYGAALILQSLAVEQRFCAVVAESSFSRFRTVASERTAYYAGMPASSLVPKLLTPAVWVALAYTPAFYGLDLLKANPADAVHQSKTPVLLIHGEDDVNILPWHSRYIAQHNPDHTQLWMVPHAGHTATLQLDPRQFDARVMNWFEEHGHAGETKVAATVSR